MNYLEFSPFGLFIYEHISRRGWTQTELARRAGVTPGVINKAMRGARPVTVAVADAIAAALEIDTNVQLLKGAQVQMPPAHGTFKRAPRVDDDPGAQQGRLEL